MDIFSSVILGLVEGLTEFVPVSSSGHLIIARHLLGLQADGGLAFDAVLQLATILALLVYFWKDLWGIFFTFLKWVARRPIADVARTQLAAIVIGTIPAVIAGLLLEKYLNEWFRGVGLVAVAMLAGSLLMWWAERVAKKNEQKDVANTSVQSASGNNTVGNTDGKLTLMKGLKIGLYQCLAIIPGVSRSGATISGGLLTGLDRAGATRFSFLLSFPIIAGSGAKMLLELIHTHALGSLGIDLLVASAVAFVVGLAAIHFLITYLKTHTMSVFIWYRVVFAVITLAVLFFVK
jgi:undecaprenyl-diphosphatase